MVLVYFEQSPNILGFMFGLVQMILYLIFKNAKKEALPEFKLQEIPPNDVVQNKSAEDNANATTKGNVANETSERHNDESIV